MFTMKQLPVAIIWFGLWYSSFS